MIEQTNQILRQKYRDSDWYDEAFLVKAIRENTTTTETYSLC